MRLAYVAATRARDLLVVPAVGDGPHVRSWVHPLSPAIYPTREARDLARADGAALHLPSFTGRDSVLDRPDGQGAGGDTVRPGIYTLVDPVTGGSYDVVWWDPLLLEGPGEERRGLRREDLIAKGARPDVVAADTARYETWRAWRADAVTAGAQPSMRLVTVSEWADAEGDIVGSRDAVLASEVDARAPGIDVADAGRPDDARPSGRRFGILVHALLAAVPLDATAEDVSGFAGVQARLLAASDEERDAAARTVAQVLGHPILGRARDAEAAGRACRREMPVSLVAGTAIIDGQADLVWDDGEEWVVVDFKTDVEMAGAEAAYRRQVAIYAEAVARVTGRPTKGVLLRV